MKRTFNAMALLTDAHRQTALDIINTSAKIGMTQDAAIDLVARRFGIRHEVIWDWYYKVTGSK